MPPFVSKSQREWMYENKPKMAAEWEAATPAGARLPEHVSKTAKKNKRKRRERRGG